MKLIEAGTTILSDWKVSESDEWVSVYDAAERANVTLQHITQYCRLGRLEARKEGREWRISPNSLREFIRIRQTRALTVFSSVNQAVLIAIDNSGKADSTKRHYSEALKRYFATGGDIRDVASLREYALTLPMSMRAHLKYGVLTWAAEATQTIKGNVTPTSVLEAQAYIMNLEALCNVIRVKEPKGQRLAIWLSKKEVVNLLGTCDRNTLKGYSDWVTIAIEVGAGLRRKEARWLTFDDIVSRPVKGIVRTIFDVHGEGPKGKKRRIIPINDGLAQGLDAWHSMVGDGYVLRTVVKGKIRERMGYDTIAAVVKRHGEMIGYPDLQCHDLRRTYAQIGFDAGVPLPQIQKLLGHAKLETTMRYLNIGLNLTESVCDFVPLS